MIDNINKFPIIILSSPRTGSSFLSEIIASSYPNLKLFSEPDANNLMDSFNEYSKNSNEYILKCHLFNLVKYPIVIKKIVTCDAFLIKLRRRNVIEQMISHYVALIRRKWYYDVHSAQTYRETTITIEDKIIEKAVRQINEFNEPAGLSNIKYDLEIYYEDFINNNTDVYNTKSTITPKPINHNEIYQLIKTELEKG